MSGPVPIDWNGGGASASGDAEARRRIRESLDESLIVEASAGTGKTTELIRRIVAVLATGRATIDKIAAVTFTNKAAGELKLRLREALDHARRDTNTPEAPAYLEHALEHLEEASIGTIHSFCAQLLRERPVEARVDPAFEELSDQEAGRLFQSAFRTWLEHQLSQPSPALRRAFARLAWRDSWDSSPPLEQLQYAARKLIEWRDYPAPWRREPFAREEEIRTLLGKARELAEWSSRPRRVTDSLYRALQPARLMVQGIDRSNNDRSNHDPSDGDSTPDYDTLEAQILKLGRDLRRDTKKGSGEYGGGIARENLISARDELLVWIEEFRRRADADLAAGLREEMAALVETYEASKQSQGKLDFVDLLIYARDLVRGDEAVRSYLQRRFTHLFVDEFQDTDPLQAEILLLLASSDPAASDWREVTPAAGKLFLVGDPKQSIYKFRRADIVLYRKIRDDLVERGTGLVRLTKSFRSVLNVQRFVNAAFETEMAGDAHADYAPLERHREDQPGRPSVIALPVPKPYRSRLAKAAVNESLPEAIAAFIHWLIEASGWTCHRDSDDVPEPIRARDIAVLFRRRTQGGSDLTREYSRALEARGVDHILAGSKFFHHREEVETVRAALTAVEWPDDELSVYAALKGSLFAIPDELLLLHKHSGGRGNGWRRLHPFHREGAESPVKEALELLAELHRRRNYRPFVATVNALLEATRAHAGFLLRPGGNQILANVMRVADLARTYEATGGVSFRGFVEELAAQAEKGEAAEAPVLEEDSDGVRLLTVHGAKGLEFPVVILADLTANLAARDPDLYVDGDAKLCATRLLRCAPWELLDHESGEAALERAEGVRVAYVAATRARDLLVVPAVGDEPFPIDGWLSPLDKALYPSRDAWRDATAAEGCPEFGASSVADRPRDYDSQPEFSVKPGLIRPATAYPQAHDGEPPHEVVWWDPRLLRLGLESDFGLHQEKLLKDDGGASMAAYRQWQEERSALLQAASVPRFDVFLASQSAKQELPSPPDSQADSQALVEVLSTARPRAQNGAGGRRFGTLVHAVLADVPLDAEAQLIQLTARMHARILGANAAETEAAGAAVAAALGHPLLQRARAIALAGGRWHREYPVTLALEENRLLESVIDLAFVETLPGASATWVVVDFKTDADLVFAAADHEARIKRYRRQVEWYAYALTRLTGLPARGYLLQL